MKVSDYIVEFLIKQGVTDVFGYPGGMVTHLMESFRQRQTEIRAHVAYHEQGAAFAACGYAQASGKPGVAYATSGPGATNLVTGICNAYFDSLPTFFITGQVNTYEAKGSLPIRQKGFQETDIISMVKGVTKYCAYIANEKDIRLELERAWFYANTGRKGPVLLDIPMDVQRKEISLENLKSFQIKIDNNFCVKDKWKQFQTLMQGAQRPVLLLGGGVKTAGAEKLVQAVVEKWNVPVVTSMLAVDILGNAHPNYFGFIGAYGSRTANFIVAKSDLVISIGSRLDIRQVGADEKMFGGNAKLVRIDIDEGEFSRKIKNDELQIQCDLCAFLTKVMETGLSIPPTEKWLEVCNTIKKSLERIDAHKATDWIQEFSYKLPEEIVITTDVGQNQVWIAQAFYFRKGQKVLSSGGHGAMGYSLPAAIGAYYGSKKPVVCFSGDGGLQMNIQELQFIVRESLPITIVILNNSSLGMIRHFQEMYFEKKYYQTTNSGGYTTPDFHKIANAYGIEYYGIRSAGDIKKYTWKETKACIVEMCLEEQTYVFPKLEYGKPNQDQEPLIDRKLYNYLMDLDVCTEKHVIARGGIVH